MKDMDAAKLAYDNINKDLNATRKDVDRVSFLPIDDNSPFISFD